MLDVEVNTCLTIFDDSLIFKYYYDLLGRMQVAVLTDKQQLKGK